MRTRKGSHRLATLPDSRSATVRARQVILLGLVLLFTLPAFSQTAGFTRRVWSVSDGIPEPIVQIVAQDHEGFLLVGTSGGLTRFDGARFDPVLAEGSGESLSLPIYCLLVAADGSIWAGTEGEGLIHVQGKQITKYGIERGLTDPFVRGLIQDAQGRIWAGTDNGLFVSEGLRFKRIDDAGSATPLAVAAIAIDKHQRIWAGGSELVVVDGDRLQRVALPGAYSQNRVKSLLQANDGTFWVGTVGGLLRRTNDRFQAVPGIKATVRCLTQTAEGAIWIGTIGQGIWTAQKNAVKRLDHDRMLPSETVLSIDQDQSRRMWIGTQNGLVRLESTSVQVIPLPNETEADYGTISEASADTSWVVVQNLFRVSRRGAERIVEPGLPKDGLRSVFRANDGSVWVGTDGEGAYHRELSGHVTHFLAPRELTNNFIRVFLEDAAGNIWIGTDQGISRVSPRGPIDQFTVANGLSQFSIRDLFQDRHGDVWIGTDKGLTHWYANNFVHDAVTAALANEKVWSILQDRRGILWFGTRDHGLYRYGGSSLQHYTVSQGLISNSIYKILQDGKGTFWLSGPDTISSFSESALDGPYPVTQPLPNVRYQMPYEADGAQLYGGRQSAGYIDKKDTVWFPTNRGAAHILGTPPASVNAPLARIESIAQDGRPIVYAEAANVLARTTRLDIGFAPLYLGSQRGLRFRYMLENFDRGWIQAGTTHVASYTNLPPGTFRFRVVAFDTTHPEHTTEASILIVKQRYYYQTWWFRCGCVLVLGALVFAGYRVHLSRIRSEFDATLKERARIAREMHDTVIQGCTGISVLLEALASQQSAVLKDNPLFQHARTQIVATVDEARDMVWNLRHAEKIDLASSLEALARQASQAFGVPISYTSSGAPGMVSNLAGHEVLMITREAVSNSTSHGDPDAIRIELFEKNQAWMLQISDNGRGFNESTGDPHRHYGLTGMRERASRIGATLALHTSPGAGTVISLQLSQEDLHRTTPVKGKV